MHKASFDLETPPLNKKNLNFKFQKQPQLKIKFIHNVYLKIIDEKKILSIY